MFHWTLQRSNSVITRWKKSAKNNCYSVRQHVVQGQSMPTQLRPAYWVLIDKSFFKSIEKNSSFPNSNRSERANSALSFLKKKCQKWMIERFYIALWIINSPEPSWWTLNTREELTYLIYLNPRFAIDDKFVKLHRAINMKTQPKLMSRWRDNNIARHVVHT